MNGGDDCSVVDRGGRLAVTPVPVGWQRMVEEGAVRYISPSGTSLASLEQTRAYLLADGTCKCGLECPLNMHKVFNFDPAAMVTGSEGSKGDEDMTKLCNHRRKIVAMATLYRSMESHGPLSLPHLGPGPSLTQLPHPTTPGPSSRPQQMLPSKASATLAKGPELYQQCPPDRYGNTWSSPSSPFPRHHNTLFGDVFPGHLPATTNGNTRPSFPTELSAVGGPFLPSKALPDTLPRPYPPSCLLFPPPDEAASSQEGGPWSSRPVPLGSQASTTGSPAPTTLSSISSPAGSAEPSPQRSRHSSASSEQGLSGHRPAARPPGLDAAAPANALTNQSSNNLPSVPLGVAPEGKGPPSLLLLHPQGPGSFPASSLLSAAAKAQLASRGRPDELAASTLPSRLLLSMVGGRAPRRQRRSPTVLRLLKDSHSSAGQAGLAHPEETPTRHARPRDQLPAGEAKNGPPSSGAPAQPLSSLLSLLAPPVSSLASPGLPPVPPQPAGDSPGSLPSFQDFNSQLLSLFGQLASASSEQISGSPPQPKPPASPLGSHSTPGASSASPLTPKAPPAASPVTVPTSAMEGGGLGCPVAPGPDPFPFLAQEQALPFGNALPPGLLPLGSFPFSLTLGPETPLPPLNLQGDPEGQSLLPLVLPSLDLLQQPSGLLASLLGLPEAPCEVEREAAATEPLLEPFTGLHETLQPLLFPALSTPPAVLALNSALLATSLGPSDPGPGPPQTGLASTPVAPTSTSATSTTTEGTPSTSGRLHPLMPQLVNPLLSTTLLGDLSGLNPGSGPSLIGNPLLQAQQPLLPPSLQGPLGLQLFQGQLPLLAASNPLACLLQSLQLSSGFGVPEKSVQPSEAPAPALASGAPAAETEPGHNTALPPSCTDAAPTSALEPPRALEPARQGQQEAPPGQEASSSRSPLKRPRRGTEDLNGDSGSTLPRGPGRGGKSGRRGGGRGRGRRHFNGQLPDLGSGHPSHPAWRCNGEMVASSAESQAGPFAVQEIKGPPGRRPARRGRRRKSSGARPSARPEATRIRGPSADPGPSPLVDYTVARRPRPGRPVKNRRRKLPT
ncbi:methyl-CpG-binding domain protein 6 [Lacerta agilis]|uniref:methyl-CpG-binding domain protein 6 n=1 Tax=Lacerta agilis TaxID=80427 RepID=UPI001419B9C0|nr:methyl-CpG-binding domain protein 6 [Lacerta agilis]XP_032993481.1 methyl-CpG-binding domain protein 6 [Lacerta agilis]